MSAFAHSLDSFLAIALRDARDGVPPEHVRCGKRVAPAPALDEAQGRARQRRGELSEMWGLPRRKK